MYDPESLDIDYEPDYTLIDKLNLKWIEICLWIESKIKQLLN